VTTHAAAPRLSILLVHERFPPDYGGGGEYVVLQLAKHLTASGHRVKVLTTGDPAEASFEGVPVQRLPISRYRLNFASAQIAAAAADADLIHCFSYHSVYPAWRAGRRLGKPIVLGVLALFGRAWLRMRGPVLGRLYGAFELFLMRLPFDRRLFLSSGSLQLARTLKVPDAGDCVIAPGISLEDYHAAAGKEGVVFSGKLDGRKGIDVVQQLARELPHIPFLVIGWGDDFDKVAASSPPNMVVERFSSRKRLAQALAVGRIFLFPSKVETFGLAVAEAMASGCAVVSAAPLEFEGARVDPDDIPSVKLALTRLWEDRSLCEACGARNQELAQAYSWRIHMVQLEAVYRELTRGKRERLSRANERELDVAQ
jgi:glycosyltransferase involved in cell wall biosynthesis